MSVTVNIDSFTPDEITIEDAKHYCRVDTTTDNAMLADLVYSAQEEGLGYTHVIFGQGTITVKVYGYRALIQLPYLPYVTMDSYQVDGVDSTEYKVLGDKISVGDTGWEELVFTYSAGRLMPADVKTAYLQRVKFTYDFSDDLVYERPRYFERVLFRYREPNTFV